MDPFKEPTNGHHMSIEVLDGQGQGYKCTWCNGTWSDENMRLITPGGLHRCPKNPGYPGSAPSKKDGNPKDAASTAKVPLLSVLPLRVLSGVALGMLEGARKYGRHNYRVSGVRASVYIDAVGRHLMEYFEGNDTDAASGLHHVDKAISSLMVLRDAIYQGNLVDDRPPKVESWVEDANAKAKEIIARIPESADAHTEK